MVLGSPVALLGLLAVLGQPWGVHGQGLIPLAVLQRFLPLPGASLYGLMFPCEEPG